MNKSFKKTEINIRFPGWKTKALTFSYDDGVYADEHLIDIFNKYGLKGTFNINSGNIGANVPRKYGHARLDENAVSRLYTKGGHEVAMHTLTHPFLSKLNSAGVTYELLQDKINLEKILLVKYQKNRQRQKRFFQIRCQKNKKYQQEILLMKCYRSNKNQRKIF